MDTQLSSSASPRDLVRLQSCYPFCFNEFVDEDHHGQGGELMMTSTRINNVKQHSKTQFARTLVRRAKQQVRYACCFKDFVKDLQEQKKELIKTQKHIDDGVQHSKTQAINVPVVHAWLERESNYLRGKVDKLLKETLRKTGKRYCFCVSCPNWIWRYRMAKKLEKRKVEVQNYIKEGDMYVQVERFASQLLDDKQNLPSKEHLKFESAQDAYKQLMEALNDDKVTMIGLCGVGGCGKTVMAMGVKRNIEAEQLFHEVAFVTVSNNRKVEVRSIQEKIAMAIRFPFLGDEANERAKRLHTKLTLTYKRTLLILDDVWQVLDFDGIGIPIGDKHKNCKALITTRWKEVCSLMNCQRIIQLPNLNEEDAMALSQKIAFTSEDALAGTSKHKDEDDWKAALGRFTDSVPMNADASLQNPVNNILRISYDTLDTEEAKSLFLLCSVFPEDFEIPVEDLMRFAIGLGLVGEVSSFESARNKVSAAKNKLISSCLLLLSDVDKGECVKMHDLVRDVALQIATEENKVIKCLLKKEVNFECSSLRYLWCKEFPNKLDCSGIEFLCINTDLKVSDGIFKGMRRLRVLYLCWEGQEIGSLSTKLFKSLTNLRCLFLDWWKIDEISFVGDMKKLESLTLHRCSFFQLPEVVVTQLNNLRLLDLSKCLMGRNLYEVIGKQQQLEELYFEFDNGDDTEFFEKFNVPQALQRYQIKIGDIFEGHSPGILNVHRTLVLDCLDTSNAAAMDLTRRAEVLLLANIKGGGKNVIPDIFQIEEGGGVMNCGWIELWLWDCDGVECLVDASNHSLEVGTPFFELRILRFKRMYELRTLCWGVSPSSLFEKLEQLYIRDCPMLECLFTPEVARSLKQLEKLEVMYCPRLKRILEEDNSEDEEISRHDNMLVFPKLKQVHVYDCYSLKYIFSVTFAQNLVHLEYLEIDRCLSLEYVFGLYNQNELTIELPALKHIQITSNPKMVSISPRFCYATWPTLHEFYLGNCPSFDLTSVHTFSASRWKVQDAMNIEKHFLTPEHLFIVENDLVESIFSLDDVETIGQPVSLRLQSLQLSGLSEMKYICVGPKNSFTFQNLKTLLVSECNMLKVILPASVLRYLPELEHLEIIRCSELNQIIEEDDMEITKWSNLVSPQPCFPKLAVLIVKDCPKLKRLFCVSASNDLPNLKLLLIERANELEELIGCKQGQGDEIIEVNVELPALKVLVLVQLPTLFGGTELANVRLRVVHGCPHFSLISNFATFEELQGQLSEFDKDEDFSLHWLKIRAIIRETIESCQLFVPGETSFTSGRVILP